MPLLPIRIKYKNFKIGFYRFSIIIILTFLVSKGFTQQNTLITHYMFTQMLYNAGYAGSNEGINATGLIRQQWIGFKADDGNKVAPQTYLITVDAPIKFLHGGLGGSVSQDKIAQFSTTQVRIGYAYRHDLGPGNIGAGIQIGFNDTKIDFSKFHPVQEGDPTLAQASESDFVMDFSLGAFYKIPDKMYAGLSAEQILQTKGPTTNYQLRRHYYLTGGYYYIIPGHPAFELQPSALFMYDGAVFQFNIGALLEYNKKVWGGLEYRFQDAVSVLAGMSIKGFRVGLAYDIATNSMSRYSAGGVEVMLNYMFKIKMEKFRKSYRNTRFL